MCAWHGRANWGRVCQQSTLVYYLYCHGKEIRLISWTAWQSAEAAIRTSSRIRNAHNDSMKMDFCKEKKEEKKRKEIIIIIKTKEMIQ